MMMWALAAIVAFISAGCSTLLNKQELVHHSTTNQTNKGVIFVESPRSEDLLTKRAEAITNLCREVDLAYQKYNWGSSGCSSIDWQIFGWSHQKRPLLSVSFGEQNSTKITLVQCAIHGDELPALPMCLRFIDEIMRGVRKIPPGKRVVVQPLLNPDGFLAEIPSRTNARGVDINRNFPTKDWDNEALSQWRGRFRSNPRRFPGYDANSEPETQAIVKSIENLKPQKIISIHTPLGHLDLDTSGDEDKVRRSRFLAINMSKNSGNYRYLRFGFFPGSLGNWAGRERQIPVYTLELPEGSGKSTIEQYWQRFRLALWRAVEFDLDTGQFMEGD